MTLRDVRDKWNEEAGEDDQWRDLDDQEKYELIVQHIADLEEKAVQRQTMKEASDEQQA